MNVLKHHEEIYNQILSLIFLDEKKKLSKLLQNVIIFLLLFLLISLGQHQNQIIF